MKRGVYYLADKNDVMKTKQYYIAYFDILGYKNFFEDKESDIQIFLQNNKSIAIDTADITTEENDISQSVIYKSFSDNFIVLIEADSFSEYEIMLFLSRQIATLQFKFLMEYQIPIRGAITKGEAYIDDDIVFGSGLIKAVELEGKNALYPRIIIDDKIEKDIVNYVVKKGLIAKDEDEKYYLDFFSLLTNKTYHFDIEADEKQKIVKFCNQVVALVVRYAHIKNNLSDLSKINESAKTIYKYVWLMTKYNEFVDSRKIPARINHEVVLNKKYMIYEIRNVKRGAWPVVANCYIK